MKIKKVIAGISALAMLMTSSSMLVSAEDSTDTTEVVVSATFEDGVDGFSPRMNEGQSVEVAVATDGAHGGNGYLLCTGREKSWQGAQFLTDGVLEGGKKYVIDAWIKTPWYATVTLSMQYTDSSGSVQYTNIESVVSEGDWVELSNAKVQIPMDCTDVYLYFECSDTNVNIAIDDFTIYSTPEYKIQTDIASLKDVYSPYFKFGGAMMASELGSQATKDLVLKHYNSITFGNELKPDAVLVQSECQARANNGDETNPAVSIDSARSLLNFCQENNIPVRGHVLVWHSQTPDWFFKEGYSDDGDFVSKEVMLQRMENYIKNLMELLATEYPDVDFYAWDVVNEIWTDEGTPRQAGVQGSTGSNNSAWVQIFGDNSFVDYAFEYARKYAPEGCKLYYNDFNEYMPQKTEAIVDMVTRLKGKGLIDGIGMQSHLDVSFPSISAYEKALKAFSETGLDIQITELDVTTSDTSESGLETQAQYYSDIMDLAVKYSDSISAVVIWGTTDDQSWRASRLPVLFNEDYTAKPCYYSIVDGLDTPEVTTSEPEVTTSEPKLTTNTSINNEKFIGTITNIETSENGTDLKLTVKVADQTKIVLVNSNTTLNGQPGSEAFDNLVLNVGDTIQFSYSGSSELADFLANVEYTNVVLGDVNGDGNVNSADLLLLKKYLLGLEEASSIAWNNADYNQDTNVNTLDLLMLKKFLLGLM